MYFQHQQQNQRINQIPPIPSTTLLYSNNNRTKSQTSQQRYGGQKYQMSPMQPPTSAVRDQKNRLSSLNDQLQQNTERIKSTLRKSRKRKHRIFDRSLSHKSIISDCRRSSKYSVERQQGIITTTKRAEPQKTENPIRDKLANIRNIHEGYYQERKSNHGNSRDKLGRQHQNIIRSGSYNHHNYNSRNITPVKFSYLNHIPTQKQPITHIIHNNRYNIPQHYPQQYIIHQNSSQNTQNHNKLSNISYNPQPGNSVNRNNIVYKQSFHNDHHYKITNTQDANQKPIVYRSHMFVSSSDNPYQPRSIKPTDLFLSSKTSFNNKVQRDHNGVTMRDSAMFTTGNISREKDHEQSYVRKSYISTERQRNIDDMREYHFQSSSSIQQPMQKEQEMQGNMQSQGYRNMNHNFKISKKPPNINLISHNSHFLQEKLGEKDMEMYDFEGSDQEDQRFFDLDGSHKKKNNDFQDYNLKIGSNSMYKDIEQSMRMSRNSALNSPIGAFDNSAGPQNQTGKIINKEKQGEKVFIKKIQQIIANLNRDGMMVTVILVGLGIMLVLFQAIR